MSELDSSFSEWALRAGYSVFDRPAGAVVANSGGEIRFEYTRDDTGFLLTSAERAEDPATLMWSSHFDDILFMLIMLLGDTLRSRAGMPEIWLPFKWGECAPGYRPLKLDGRWTGLEKEGEILALRTFGSDLVYDIVSLSYLIDLDPGAVMASYADPGGHPLLHKFLRPSEE